MIDLDLGDPQVISGRDYLQRLNQHVGGIPASAIAETGSGGFHLWFAWQADAPVNNGANVVPALYIPPAEGAVASNGKAGKGAQVDVRGEGGYVIVPPSVRSDGRAYSWCPEPWDGIAEPTPALRRILTKEAKAAAGREKWAKRSAPPPPPTSPSGDAAFAQAVERYALSALDREVATVAAAGPGTRNHALNTAAFKLAQLVAAGALPESTVRSARESAAERSGLVADDGGRSVEDTIDSGFSAGLSKPRDLSEIGAKGRRAQECREGAEAGEAHAGAAGGAQAQPSDLHLARIALKYPIPLISSPFVFYEINRGRVMLHKEVPGKNGKAASTVPIATPFGATARLRHQDREDAYGLRVAVQDMAGRPRYVDIDRADLAKQGGAPVRERLFAEGMKTEDDGDHIAIRLLKAASPDIEIEIVSRPGWHEGAAFPKPIFVCPDGDIVGADPDTSIELAKRIRLTPSVARAGTLDGWKAAVAAALDLVLQRGLPIAPWRLGFVGHASTPILIGASKLGLKIHGCSTRGLRALDARGLRGLRRPGALARRARNLRHQSLGPVLERQEHGAAPRSLGMVDPGHPGTRPRQLGEVDRQRHGGDGLARERHRLQPRRDGPRAGQRGREDDLHVGRRRREAAHDGRGRRPRSLSVVELRPALVGVLAGREGEGRSRRLGRRHGGPLRRRGRVDGEPGRPAPGAGSDRGCRSALRPCRPGFRTGADAEGSSPRAGGPTGEDPRPGEAHRRPGRGQLPAARRDPLLALLQAAGVMARLYGLLPEEASIEGSVGWAWGRFMLSSDARALDPTEQVIANIRAFVISRWGVTVRHVGAGGGAQKAEAFFNDSFVYILRENLRPAANNVMTEEGTAQALNGRGYIAKTEKDRSGLYVRYVPKIGKLNAYALPRSEFGKEEDPGSGYPTGRGAGY